MIIIKNKVLCALCMLTWLGVPVNVLAQNAKTIHSSQSMDSLSYALGVLFANNLSNEGLSSVDGASLKSGFESALAGEATMSAAEADALVRNEMMKLKEAQGQAIKKEGEDFLAENSGKEGISTTETGLQYQHTLMGTGASPDANDEVTVHYRGTLLNGQEFDSSLKRGEPISFPLNGVIPGWTEGLQLMKEGGKTTFYIPQELAYGARPAPGGAIPPYSALIFEVELIKVNPRD